MNTAAFTAYREKVVSNCARVIVGKEDATEKILVSFLCGGHVLLEDKPGTGKTMLLRAFARTVGGDFKRVQFTPDLLPSDLTGINFYNQKSGEFEFRPALRQHCAGGRDQPRHAPYPVGPAGSHGGKADYRGRRDQPPG